MTDRMSWQPGSKCRRCDGDIVFGEINGIIEQRDEHCGHVTIADAYDLCRGCYHQYFNWIHELKTATIATNATKTIREATGCGDRNDG